MLFTLSDLEWLVVMLIDSLVEKLRRFEVHRLQMRPEVGVVLRDLEACVIRIRRIINAVDNFFPDILLMQLRDAVYDGEDLLEKIEHDLLHHRVDQHQYEASSQSSSSFNSSATKSTSASSPVKVHTVVEIEDSRVYKLRKIYLRLDRIATAPVKIIQVANSVDADGRQKILTADHPISSNATSFLIDGKVYGRDEEFNTLRQLLLKPSVGWGSSNGSLSIITISGARGVGKTTLAQRLYNNKSIKEYFQLKIWVDLSENFCVKSLTKEILQPAHIDAPDRMNLDMLQVVVKKKIASKRFLIVLDGRYKLINGWERREWDMLCASLSSGVPGSKILMATGFPIMVSIECEFHLGRMDKEEFWEFFKLCAFGSQSSQENPPLIDIAKTMVRRLNGLPLEARMLGGLLNANVNLNHWSTIMNTEIWQIPKYGLLPVLQISYHYLPVPLKQCFAFCSLFPRNYWFTEEKLIRIWNAEGFIVPQANRKMEDVGKSYFQELVNRSFFQRLPHKSLQEEQTIFYVMHDLIHDLAEQISEGESYRVSEKVRYLPALHQTLRHLSIFGEHVTPKSFPANFAIDKRLRTLILSRIKEPSLKTTLWAIHLFDELKCIRVLILHDCGMIEFPQTISRLIHLRYLDISDNFGIQRLPESLSSLHNLQYFDLRNCQVQTFPEGITNLINLRQLISEDETISKINNIGKLFNLQTLPTFKVLKGDGHRLTELNSLTQLHGRLRILNLENVKDKMEASAAKLHDKVHLDELVLAWTSKQNSSLDDSVLHASEEILEELKPHSKLRSLTVRGYRGARTPSWLHTETFASLETLRLENCGKWENASFIRQMLHLRSLYLKGIPAMKQTTRKLFGPPTENKFFQGLKELVLEGMDLLEELSSLGNLPCLRILHIAGMPALKTLGPEFYGFTDQGNHFPCLEELKFSNMSEWEEWSWTEDSELFPCLQVLKIEDCPMLRRLPPLPPSLTTLELWQGGLVELPGLRNKINGSSSDMIASLSKLYVSECPNLRMLEQGLLFYNLPNIESIEIHECQELLWLPVKRFKEFTSLKNLSIKDCPLLMSSTEYKSDELLLPPSIQKLTLLDCGNLSEAVPHCLSNLPSISQLEIGHPPRQR